MESRDFFRPIGRLGLIPLLLLLILQTAFAGSATWSPNPTSGEWNTAANWTPPTVPNGPGDVATFATSTITDLSLSAGTAVDGVVFDPGASAFRISAPPVAPLTFIGTGVTNNSTSVQNFIVQSDVARGIGYLSFLGTASAGNLASYTVMGATEGQPGYAILEFADNSTAGNGTFVNQGSAVHSDPDSGVIVFSGNATAGAGNFTNQAGAVRYASGAQINFYDQTSAGSATFVNDGAGDRAYGASIIFYGSATAGSASFTNNGATNVHGTQGIILFYDGSTAESASFTNNGGVSGAIGGDIQFYGTSDAGSATFSINGGSVSGAIGSGLEFYDSSSAADATFTVNGGTASGTSGGFLLFGLTSTAANATIIANGGSNGGSGGAIQFIHTATGGNCRIELFDSGNLDLSNRDATSTTIGSLEGSGITSLGKYNLAIGSNGLTTTFSGLIKDGGNYGGERGSLTKIGAGALTLSGMNDYTGGTTVESGALVVTNTAGSATGPRKVRVNGGTLGGSGTIAGATTIGTGSGTDAFLAPAAGTNVQAALTIQSALTFNADATYTYTFRAKRNRARTDKVIANGVTINSGASLALSGQTRGALTQGLVLTVISNTSANPISGTFVNLPDGGIVTVNGNNLQASYSGGDGNDLTLTVVP